MNATKWFEDFGWIISPLSGESLRDVDPNKVESLLGSGGVVLFRGFGVDEKGFIDFTGLMSKRFMKHTSAAFRKPVTDDGTVVEVTSGVGEVELHGEMYYRSEHPDFLWFHCLRPADRGGATTVCDGTAILASFSESTRNLFYQKKIKYKIHQPPDGWRALTGETELNQALKVIQKSKHHQNVRVVGADMIGYDYVASAIGKTKYTKQDTFINNIRNMRQYYGLNTVSVPGANGGLQVINKVQVCFEDDSEIPEKVLTEIYEVGQKHIKAVDWRAGEMVAIDNSRFLHGRQTFEGPRKIHSRFTMAA